MSQWLEQRRLLGQDTFDEVWDGEYHVAPMAHARRGDLDDQLAAMLRPIARRAGLWSSGPVNIGTPQNYRVPDRVVFADRAMSTYVATAEIVIEIVSPDDETYEKFGFYFQQGIKELLVVDPECRAVEWYARGAEEFERTAGSALLGLTDQSVYDGIDWPPA